MGTDSDVTRVQQQLLVSLEAVRAVATEANNVLVANPGVDGAHLARAVALLLDAQGELFERIQNLAESVSSPPDDSVDTTFPSETAPAPEPLIVAPAVVTTRTDRDYDYFTDLRRELANGEPNAEAEIATAQQDAVAIKPQPDSNGRAPESREETETAIGEFPDDWGNPREWVEAPRRLFGKGPRKRTQPAPR